MTNLIKKHNVGINNDLKNEEILFLLLKNGAGIKEISDYLNILVEDIEEIIINYLDTLEEQDKEDGYGVMWCINDTKYFVRAKQLYITNYPKRTFYSREEVTDHERKVIEGILETMELKDGRVFYLLLKNAVGIKEISNYYNLSVVMIEKRIIKYLNTLKKQDKKYGYSFMFSLKNTETFRLAKQIYLTSPSTKKIYKKQRVKCNTRQVVESILKLMDIKEGKRLFLLLKNGVEIKEIANELDLLVKTIEKRIIKYLNTLEEQEKIDGYSFMYGVKDTKYFTIARRISITSLPGKKLYKNENIANTTRLVVESILETDCLFLRNLRKSNAQSIEKEKSRLPVKVSTFLI